MIPALLRYSAIGGNLSVTSAVTHRHFHKAIHHGLREDDDEWPQGLPIKIRARNKSRSVCHFTTES